MYLLRSYVVVEVENLMKLISQIKANHPPYQLKGISKACIFLKPHL